MLGRKASGETNNGKDQYSCRARATVCAALVPVVAAFVVHVEVKL